MTWLEEFLYCGAGPAVAIPLMVPVLLAMAAVWDRFKKKPRPGHCPHCDYDLTGNVSGRCPECGTPRDSTV